jgi:hypothetical protein
MTINNPIPRRSPRKIDSIWKPGIGSGTTAVLVVIICVLDTISVVLIILELVNVIVIVVIGICRTRPAGIMRGVRNVLAVRAMTTNGATINALRP